MINSTLALAIAAAGLAAQATRPAETANFSRLDKVMRAAALHELRGQRHAPEIREHATETRRGGLERGPCGMPIIAADASIDPKMIIPIPGSARSEATIRTAEPPRCGPFAVVPARPPHPTPDKRR